MIFNYLGYLNLSPSDSIDPIMEYFVNKTEVEDQPYNNAFEEYDIF